MYSYLNTRMNRQTYWMILAPVVVLFGLAIAFLPKPPGIAEVIMISLGVPRLHDLGRSGWWMAVPIGLEVVAVILGAVVGGMDGILVAGGLVVLLLTIMMIVLGLIPGQPQANAFGEPPSPGFAAWRKPA
ncbi:MAG TPA: DUF805 domain-containing protein [Rhizomicrobium sp.]|nr:DUF805 domain-containing protein [Rhizomicrobium sp.]